MADSAANMEAIFGSAWHVNGLAIYKALGHKTGAVTPLSAVTPDFIGQEYFDTVAVVFHRAVGLTSADWTVISVAGVTAAELGVLDGATNANAGTGKAVILGTSGAVTVAATATHGDGANLAFGTTTGSLIGVTSSQKMGFYGVATPVGQPAATAQSAFASTAITTAPTTAITTAPTTTITSVASTSLTALDVTRLNAAISRVE